MVDTSADLVDLTAVKGGTKLLKRWEDRNRQKTIKQVGGRGGVRSNDRECNNSYRVQTAGKLRSGKAGKVVSCDSSSGSSSSKAVVVVVVLIVVSNSEY